MSTRFSEWKVGEHGPTQRLESNLWRVEGEVARTKLRRVMTVVKMLDGGLLVHSPIALVEPQMRELEAWGTIRYVVVPNAYHRLDVARFKYRYPDAQVVCPKAARKRVSEMAPVDITYDVFPNDDTVVLRHLDGTNESEGVLTVKHRSTSSVVLNDLVFNMPHQPSFMGWMLRYVTKSSGGPVISRVARWLIIKDKRAVVQELKALAATPGLARVIVSHHKVIDERPGETLEALANSL